MSLLVLTGCASTGPPFRAEAEIPAEKALIYVYRASKFVGGGVSYKIHVNNEFERPYAGAMPLLTKCGLAQAARR